MAATAEELLKPRYLHTFSERLFESRDVYGIPMSNFVIVLAVLLSCLKNIFFRQISPLAHKLTDSGLAYEVPEETKKLKHEKIANKLTKYIFHFIWFSIMVPWNICLCHEQPWFSWFYTIGRYAPLFAETGYGMRLIKDANGKPTVEAIDYDADPWMQAYYLFACIQMAWYCHSFVEDTLWERTRGDYWMMVLHHLVTITLLWASLHGNVEYAGVLVLLPMDTMDFVLYTGKIFHLLSNTIDGVPRSPRLAKGQTLFMCFIALFWLVTRIWSFNIIEVSYILANTVHTNVWSVSLKPGESRPFYIYFSQVAGISLIILQTVWGYMIWRITYRLLKTGTLTDGCFNTYDQKIKPDDIKPDDRKRK